MTKHRRKFRKNLLAFLGEGSSSHTSHACNILLSFSAWVTSCFASFRWWLRSKLYQKEQQEAGSEGLSSQQQKCSKRVCAMLPFLRDLKAPISIIFKESWRIDFRIFELPPKPKGYVFVEFAGVTFTKGTTCAMLISSVLIDCFIALPYLKILSHFNHKGHVMCKHSRSLRSINNELLRFLSMQAKNLHELVRIDKQKLETLHLKMQKS